jgi:hypothetical protein
MIENRKRKCFALAADSLKILVAGASMDGRCLRCQ